MFFQKKYFTIFIIQITEVLGFSLILPFLPFYAEELGASPLLVGLIFASFSFFQFLSAPIMGRLSDIYGRKPLLILSQISTFLGFLLLGFANTLWMVFAARIIDGLLGSNMTIAQAYLSDVSSPEERSKAFGISGVAFGFGFLVGPALGGFLSQFSYSLPAFIAAGVSFITIITTSIFLKETVHRDKSTKFKIKILDLKVITGYFGRTKLRPKLWQFFTYIFNHTLWVTSFALYAERQIGLKASHIGFTLAYVGLISILVRGLFLSKLIDKFGETRLKFAGIISIIIGLVLSIFIDQWWMFFIVMTFFSFGSGLSRPLLMGTISRSVSAQEQGAVLGVTNSLQSISQIFGPLLGGFLINTFIPGSLGLVAAFIMIVGLLIMIRDCKSQPDCLEN